MQFSATSKCYICLHVINKLHIRLDILTKRRINGHYRPSIDLFLITANHPSNVKWGYVVVSPSNLFSCWLDAGLSFLWVWCGHTNLCVNVNIYLHRKSGQLKTAILRSPSQCTQETAYPPPPRTTGSSGPNVSHVNNTLIWESYNKYTLKFNLKLLWEWGYGH